MRMVTMHGYNVFISTFFHNKSTNNLTTTLPFNCAGTGNSVTLRFTDLRLVCRPPSTPGSSLPHTEMSRWTVL